MALDSGASVTVELLATAAAVPGDSGIQTPEVPHLMSISQKKRKKRNEAWYECKRRVRQCFIFY